MNHPFWGTPHFRKAPYFGPFKLFDPQPFSATDLGAEAQLRAHLRLADFLETSR